MRPTEWLFAVLMKNKKMIKILQIDSFGDHVATSHFADEETARPDSASDKTELNFGVFWFLTGRVSFVNLAFNFYLSL